jgi:hypothetical protein
MNSENQPTDPFADFINRSLDMQGVDGLDQAAIVERVRDILKTLPREVGADLWNEQLDGLQSVIRVCMDLSTVMGAFEEKLDSTEFTRDDLETLVMLSVTFAFVSYNQIKPAYDADQANTQDNTLMARRLRENLLASFGWVKRAAREGDVIADKLVPEISAALDASDRLE